MCASKALIVEDEPDLRDILHYHLVREGFAVESTPDGYEALGIARRLRPDIILLDLLLAGLDGFSLCRQFKADPAAAETHIIMISALVGEEDVLRGLALGADDYVRKPFRPKEVVARVRAVLRRAAGRAGDIRLERLIHPPLILDDSRHEVTLKARPLALTATEYRILNTLMRAPGRVFTREQLLRRTRGEEDRSCGRAVDVHVRSLRKALGAYAGMVETERGVGYRFNPCAVLTGSA